MTIAHYPTQSIRGGIGRRLAFSRERAMVRGMSMTVLPHTAARPADATVVVCVMDVAGSRHEVLPPRMIGAGVDVLFRSARRAPPP